MTGDVALAEDYYNDLTFKFVALEVAIAIIWLFAFYALGLSSRYLVSISQRKGRPFPERRPRPCPQHGPLAANLDLSDARWNRPAFLKAILGLQPLFNPPSTSTAPPDPGCAGIENDQPRGLTPRRAASGIGKRLKAQAH